MSYKRLVARLKKTCGTSLPTVAQIEDAMGDLDLPSNLEVDVDALMSDLASHSADKTDYHIRNVTRKYDKMAREAKRLTSTTSCKLLTAHIDSRRNGENQQLLDRLDDIRQRAI